MRLIYILFIVLISKLGFAQTKTRMSEDLVIEKWTKAIVNLECRPSRDNKEINDIADKYFKGEASLQELTDASNRYILEVSRYTGTAVYLKYKDRHYFVTARHVIEDANSIYKKYDSEPSDHVFDKIFLVANGSKLASSDSITHDSRSHEDVLLMNYNAGTSYHRPFSFSPKEDDLAILKIDCGEHRGVEFIETLSKRGYIPIDISDIDLKCSVSKGQEIISFGFTGDGSVVSQKKLSIAEFSWESDLISLPIVSKGTVDKNVVTDKMFSGNIFVYHGNSGGPIVSNGKLVGIVSNATVPIKRIQTSSLEYYLSREINFVKSSLILPMLTDLEERLADPWEYMQKKRNQSSLNISH